MTEIPLSMEGFAVAFLRHAASPERVASITSSLLGEQITFGPVPVGPGGIATATALGGITSVRSFADAADGTRFRLLVDIDLRITVRIAGQTVSFTALMTNTVRIGLRLVEPLHVVIVIDEVRPDDIELDLKMPAVVARALQRIGNIDTEVRRHTTDYIAELASTDRAAALLRIDIAELVDAAWAGGLITGRDVT